MQANTILMKIKVFFTKKKIIWTVVVVILLLGGWFIFGGKSDNSDIQTGLVKFEDIEKTVLSTGQVVSSTDLSLSMQSSGEVKRVFVEEGDAVYAGKLLAELDLGDLAAQLRSAQAGLTLALQQASASRNNVANVVAQQKTLVGSAYRTLLSSALVAAPDSDSYTVSAPTISGAYNGPEGTYKIIINKEKVTDTDLQLRTYNLEKTDNVKVEFSEPTRFGTHGLYVTFPDAIANYNETIWYVTIPNTKSSSYLSNYNTYQQALRTQEKAIADAEASIGSDAVAVVDAQIAQAQATVDSINVKINNARLVAPTNGTITQVNIKVGETAQATAEAMKLLNVGELHTEALVSEADIASVIVGQSIDNTFDALGPDKHFTTTVLTVNPASTVISGVVNYKVTGSLAEIPEVKPGMTVNMTIKVAEKQNALVVPSSAIINKDGKRIVRVITDPKKKTYTETEVETGLEADGGLTEIISGLSEGQEIVTYIK